MERGILGRALQRQVDGRQGIGLINPNPRRHSRHLASALAALA